MREVNKDLKAHFKQLESKVFKLNTAEVSQKEKAVGKENNDSCRENLLTQISVLISEYKQKAVYDNMLTNMNQKVGQPPKKTVTINQAMPDVYRGALF